MEDKPRYSRVSDIVDLIIFMLSKLNGVTLAEIQERFNVSRRTAERMRDSVLSILPQVDEIETDGRQKRWGFINFTLNELVTFSHENIAVLEKLKSNCDKLTEAELNEIIIKINALMRNPHKRINSNNVELILQSEGYAVKQSQNYKVDLNIVSVIRQAIKENKKINAIYNDKPRLLEPLGLILGEKTHLIAREKSKGNEEYNYVLHKLKDVKILQEKFDTQGFNLQEYSKKSFGVYFGKIYNVKLRFIPEAAEDVLNYNFHPTQKMKVQEDGSVIVTFKASGDKHIIWNLFKWGYAVDILAPKSLKIKYKNYIDEIRAKL